MRITQQNRPPLQSPMCRESDGFWKMKVVDLTHTIEENMPVYPGTEGPALLAANSYETDGFRETLLRLYSHTGTHMDAPAHLFAERTTLDVFPAEQFVGPALVIPCTDLCDGETVGMERIERVRKKADAADFLLFHFAWDLCWGSETYFNNYPVLSDEVVSYLITSRKKGVGLDVIGIDPVADESLRIDKNLFLETEIVVIENLKNLAEPGEDLFLFCALPLKFHNADGAPVRAIAILED